MALAERCTGSFPSKIRARGRNYANSRCVSNLSRTGDRVSARVEGSYGDYDVVIDWSEADAGLLSVDCSCPHFADGFACKHLWATILVLDRQGIGRTIPGPPSLELVTDEFVDEEAAEATAASDDFPDFDDLPDFEEEQWSFSWHPGPRPPATRSGTQRQSRRAAERAPGWQRHLDALARTDPGSSAVLAGNLREVWYVLNVNAGVAADSLTVDLFQREKKLNGEFGKMKPLTLSQHTLDRMTSETTDPADRELLTLLFKSNPPPAYGSYGYYGYAPATSTVSVPAALHEFVLPRLCATGRLLWRRDAVQPVEEGRPVAWDAGEPWRFQLAVATDESSRQWHLSGRLVRPSEPEPVPLERAVLVDSGGLVLFEDRLARLDCAGVFPWISLLRREGRLTVPFQDREALLEKLWRMPALPDVEWPADLRPEEVRLPPQGRLQIHAPDRRGRSGRLPADVSFAYDGQFARATDRTAGIFDAGHNRVLVRDTGRERTLLSRLEDLGLRADGSHGSREADLAVPERQLPQIIEQLVRDGWLVEAEGRRIRQPGAYHLSVRSDVDWFELGGEFDFSGASAKLPDLLAAARRGDRYVTLDDGSQGLLPEAWLAQYAPVAALGEANGEAVRFRPSQALLLDALLSAQEQHADIDERFAQYRSKLRSFEGVAPRDKPRWFEGTLREYQKDGLGWLHFLKDFGFGGCLADDMGLGKTIQVLALLEARRVRRMPKGHQRAPSLAVVPKSLVFNWSEEAARFAPRLRVAEYHGGDRKEILERIDEFDLLVTTYGTLRRDIKQLKDIRFDYVILDEAQAIKNAKSQAAKACRLLNCEHRLALTGTPIENHLGELWSLFEFLNPGLLGRSAAFQALSKRVADDKDALGFLARAVAPYMLRRTKEQVLTELPAKNEQTLHCELPRQQRRQYDELRDHYRAMLSRRIEAEGLEKSKIHVLEALLRLRQAACHPGLLDKDQADRPSAKFDVLLEQLDEVVDGGHKALVFSQFTTLLGLLRRRLDEAGLTYEYLDGRTQKRQRKVQRFQEDTDCPLFLISLKAGGHGLNLTAADYVYILDPWWNPAVEAQAVDRAHRIGQTRPVFAYRLIARDTIEEKILELQQTKRDLAEAVVSANDSLIRQLTAEDLQLLLS